MVRGSRRALHHLKETADISKTLLDILVCPLSKQPMRYCRETQSLISDQMGVSFPVVAGIPCLVPKDGKILKDEEKFLGFRCIVLQDVCRAWIAGEASTAEDLQTECCVCLSRLDEGAGTRKLPCCHLFHRECVNRWLSLCQRTCPLCRISVDPMLPSVIELDYNEELVIWLSAFLVPGY